MPQLVDAAGMEHAASVREALVQMREAKDLIEIGAYKSGSNPRLDHALARSDAIEAFLRQDVHDLSPLAETRELLELVATGGN